MNNTPLQQLRDKLNEKRKEVTKDRATLYSNGYKMALVDIMYLIDEFKESEKQAIIDAYNQGYRDGYSEADCGVISDKDVSEFDDAEQYFNNTYKQQDDKERQGDSI